MIKEDDKDDKEDGVLYQLESFVFDSQLYYIQIY